MEIQGNSDSPARSARTADIAALAVPAVALLLFAFGVLYISSLPDNHDVAWLLYASGEVLGGAELYVDVVESNPPLIFFFTVVVKALSTVTGIRDFFVFKAIVSALIAASLFLCWVVLRRASGRLDYVPASIFFLVSVFCLVPLVGYHFGQREHLAIVLSLPYLLAAAGRADGASFPTGLAVAAGLAGGIGLAIKPFFLLVWLGIEAYLYLSCSRSLWKRPEQLAVLAVFLVYSLLAAILTPAFFRLAITAIPVYDGYHSYGPSYIARYWVTLLMLLVFLGQSNVPASAELRHSRRILTVATAMFWLAVFVQNKGWDYHWIHVKVTSLLLLTLVMIDAMRLLLGERWNQRARKIAVGVVALALLVSTALTYRTVEEEWARLGSWPWRLYEMAEVVENHAPGGTISALSTTMQAGFPLVNYTDAKWGSRFPCLWLLPGLYMDVNNTGQPYPYHPPEKWGELERYIVDSVVSDLRKYRPDLLIVDDFPPGVTMRGFDYVEYFSQDPRFRKLIDLYAPLVRIENYRIYKRIGG